MKPILPVPFRKARQFIGIIGAYISWGFLRIIAGAASPLYGVKDRVFGVTQPMKRWLKIGVFNPGALQ